MGKIRVVELNEHQKKELEKGYREGKTHFFRQLCQMILLKSEGRISKELAGILGKCEQSISTLYTREQKGKIILIEIFLAQ